MQIFGYNITRAGKPQTEKSFVAPSSDEGGIESIRAGGYYGTYLDIEGIASTEAELIKRYRDISMMADVDTAIEDIVNDSISYVDAEKPVSLNLDETGLSASVKKSINAEFESVLKMLDFKTRSQDYFRRWYIDGRLYFHKVIDTENPRAGIKDVRYIDPRKITKVRNVKKDKNPNGASFIKDIEEYYIYSEKGLSSKHGKYEAPENKANALKITKDAIAYCPSGLVDYDKNMALSYLHKAIRPANQLRMMEDALVIYRLARAPERRIFYVDVGNLPRNKAEQYLKDIMTRYRNKLVYDANTGDLKNESKHMSMLEDFWLPRREGGRGTEISTLPGGQNLGEIDDILYFQKKLYKALNVPVSRLDPEQGGGGILGRTTEITRDEFKFQKFVDRLRRRFADLFYNILKKQLLLKGIITEEDWKEWKNDITLEYITDNYFTELKDAEILRERLNMLRDLEPYLGSFYSKEWTQKNVLMLSDDDIKTMKDQIDKEKKSGEIEEPEPEPEPEPAPEPAPEPQPEPEEGDEGDDDIDIWDVLLRGDTGIITGMPEDWESPFGPNDNRPLVSQWRSSADFYPEGHEFAGMTTADQVRAMYDLGPDDRVTLAQRQRRILTAGLTKVCGSGTANGIFTIKHTAL